MRCSTWSSCSKRFVNCSANVLVTVYAINWKFVRLWLKLKSTSGGNVCDKPTDLSRAKQHLNAAVFVMTSTSFSICDDVLDVTPFNNDYVLRHPMVGVQSALANKWERAWRCKSTVGSQLFFIPSFVEFVVAFLVQVRATLDAGASEEEDDLESGRRKLTKRS